MNQTLRALLDTCCTSRTWLGHETQGGDSGLLAPGGYLRKEHVGAKLGSQFPIS